MNIGERIKQCRKKAGLTQSKLANECGVATGTIQQYELGKRQPRFEQVELIASKLKVPIWELLGMTKQDALLMHGNDFLNNTPYDTESLSATIARDVIYENNFKKLRKAFDLLNREGQEEAVKRVNELALLPKYQKTEE